MRTEPTKNILGLPSFVNPFKKIKNRFNRIKLAMIKKSVCFFDWFKKIVAQEIIIKLLIILKISI